MAVEAAHARAQGMPRRTVLESAAALGVAAPLVAACGSDDGGDSDVSRSDAGTVLVATAEVPVGGARSWPTPVWL